MKSMFIINSILRPQLQAEVRKKRFNLDRRAQDYRLNFGLCIITNFIK